jgi:uncharacterized protein
MVDKKLLEILACPACKGDIIEKENKIICLKCGKKYPVIDDIPVMLIDEAITHEGERDDKKK